MIEIEYTQDNYIIFTMPHNPLWGYELQAHSIIQNLKKLQAKWWFTPLVYQALQSVLFHGKGTKKLTFMED